MTTPVSMAFNLQDNSTATYQQMVAGMKQVQQQAEQTAQSLKRVSDAPTSGKKFDSRENQAAQWLNEKEIKAPSKELPEWAKMSAEQIKKFEAEMAGAERRAFGFGEAVNAASAKTGKMAPGLKESGTAAKSFSEGAANLVGTFGAASNILDTFGGSAGGVVDKVKNLGSLIKGAGLYVAGAAVALKGASEYWDTFGESNKKATHETDMFMKAYGSLIQYVTGNLVGPQLAKSGEAFSKAMQDSAKAAKDSAEKLEKYSKAQQEQEERLGSMKASVGGITENESIQRQAELQARTEQQQISKITNLKEIENLERKEIERINYLAGEGKANGLEQATFQARMSAYKQQYIALLDQQKNVEKALADETNKDNLEILNSELKKVDSIEVVKDKYNEEIRLMQQRAATHTATDASIAESLGKLNALRQRVADIDTENKDKEKKAEDERKKAEDERQKKLDAEYQARTQWEEELKQQGEKARDLERSASDEKVKNSLKHINSYDDLEKRIRLVIARTKELAAEGKLTHDAEKDAVQQVNKALERQQELKAKDKEKYKDIAEQLGLVGGKAKEAANGIQQANQQLAAPGGGDVQKGSPQNNPYGMFGSSGYTLGIADFGGRGKQQQSPLDKLRKKMTPRKVRKKIEEDRLAEVDQEEKDALDTVLLGSEDEDDYQEQAGSVIEKFNRKRKLTKTAVRGKLSKKAMRKNDIREVDEGDEKEAEGKLLTDMANVAKDKGQIDSRQVKAVKQLADSMAEQTKLNLEDSQRLDNVEAILDTIANGTRARSQRASQGR